MSAGHVTGLNLAVINDNKPVFLQSFGLRDKEKKLPMTIDTVCAEASLTKVIFASLVMQLVDEGVIDLDRPIQAYLSKPLPEYPQYHDLAGDERYKKITARMLLSHTAGFPNWRFFNPDEKLNINFEPGSRYAYSGEGIDLLQFVVEQRTGQSVGDMVQRRIFDRFGMTRSGMTWKPQFEGNYAIGYDEQEKRIGHRVRTKVNAAGSMDTTIDDYTKFIVAIMNGRLLSEKAKAEMIRPQIEIHSVQQFPSLRTDTTDRDRKIQLAYGLGWGLMQTPSGKSFFKEGHDDGWENYGVCFPEKKTAIIIMTNSSNGEGIFKELLERVISDTFTPWEWENYVPYDSNRPN